MLIPKNNNKNYLKMETNINLEKPFIIGIGGGTSSGKTTVAKSIINRLENDITYISYDNYYLDQSHLCPEERSKINFDHPSSLDTDKLFNDLQDLINGKEIEMPIYDFVTHTRHKKSILVKPNKIFLIEGILTLNDIRLRNIMNIKIFVDTEADERFIRRLTRDLKERGRKIDDIIEQYKNTVKPMHVQFIEPTKVFADIIIPSGYNKAAVDIVINGLMKYL